MKRKRPEKIPKRLKKFNRLATKYNKKAARYHKKMEKNLILSFYYRGLGAQIDAGVLTADDSAEEKEQ